MFQDVNQSSEHLSEEGKVTNTILFICNFPGGKNITYINVKNDRNSQGVLSKGLALKGLTILSEIIKECMDVRIGLWRKLSAKELMLLNCGIRKDSWEFPGLQGDPTSPFWRRSALGFLWKEWCWSWNSSTLATSCKELTHWKRLWWRWEGCMASLTRWTWVWVNSGSWWWTGRPGVLRFTGSQRVGHDWATELNWILKYVTRRVLGTLLLH